MTVLGGAGVALSPLFHQPVSQHPADLGSGEPRHHAGQQHVVPNRLRHRAGLVHKLQPPLHLRFCGGKKGVLFHSSNRGEQSLPVLHQAKVTLRKLTLPNSHNSSPAGAQRPLHPEAEREPFSPSYLISCSAPAKKCHFFLRRSSTFFNNGQKSQVLAATLAQRK